jgi:hypothetical protein
MIIYNVTTHVDKSIHTAWLEWMKTTHIPEIMQTGCFMKYQLTRLLDIDEAEGPTYAAQYYAESRASYNRYVELFAANLRKAAAGRWGDKIISFRSLMEVVH